MALRATQVRCTTHNVFIVLHLVGLALLSSNIIALMMSPISDQQSDMFDLPSQSRMQMAEPLSLEDASTSQIVKPILYLHFHKAGGTSVCKTVRANLNITDSKGRHIPEQDLDSRNCNLPYIEPNSDAARHKQFQTCRYLTPLTTDENGTPFRRNNFVAVEVPFQEEMPCPGFRSFAIMRDPIARVLSHIKFHNWSDAVIEKWIARRTPSPRSFLKGYPVLNSMVIRQLLGRRRWMNPRPIDEEDFERAKQLVDSFDAFVPLEHLHHSNVHQLLNITVPEYYQGIQGMNISANVSTKRRPPSTDAFLRQITEENKYDIMLYQYMLEKLDLVQSTSTGRTTVAH
jgi:hypothetical protein